MTRSNRTAAHPTPLPRPLLLLAAAYFLASLAHFSHNAEYIAFYPGMPQWLTAERIYLAWSGVTSIGLVAFLLLRFGLPVPALFVLAAYGAFGLDGLAHYTLGLCSEHTLAANLTIWSEALSGLVLVLACALLLARRVAPASGPRGAPPCRERS